jgi:hypothetical protein
MNGQGSWGKRGGGKIKMVQGSRNWEARELKVLSEILRLSKGAKPVLSEIEGSEGSKLKVRESRKAERSQVVARKHPPSLKLIRQRRTSPPEVAPVRGW